MPVLVNATHNGDAAYIFIYMYVYFMCYNYATVVVKKYSHNTSVIGSACPIDANVYCVYIYVLCHQSRFRGSMGFSNK